ncbi:MAG TPA: nucleoside-diphosphate sugar epimerase/dehydratase [Pilimelia sp.]|nr:nucleoside-diphosphate sugar epimerase/dehydratase [Pilimelia sp.]
MTLYPSRADAGRGARRFPGLAPLIVDSTAWTAGLLAAVLTRYEFTVTRDQLAATMVAVGLAVLLHSTVAHAQFLYRGRYGFGTFEEIRAVAATVCLCAVLLFVGDLAMADRPVPASAPVVGGALALTLMLGVRYLRRQHHERRLRPDARTAAPVLLFGAGTAAHHLLRSMLHDRRGRYLPVGLLDDDPAKRHLRIHGVRVLGDRSDIPAAAARTGAGTLIFAATNARVEVIRDVRRIALQAGMAFKVLPSVTELLNHRAAVTDVRDPQVADLLGRHQIEIDLAGVARALAGKRVLVTGAGGSIGSELCHQLQHFGLAELMMLDRDESALHAVQLSLRGAAVLDSPELILADLRDARGIARIFAARRPDVVFHAAALKHVPLLECHPGEAVKTNVWGTQAVLDAARDVERFVNISTDKAADPASVLGYSKRITERLTAHAARAYPGTFLNVRFGNVLGSRGSVLTSFTAQAAAGGPITLTHPEVTRYFMTVQEAVQLVVQAATIGRDGEALVLDMGEPVRIAEVAQHIAGQARSPVDIIYTGLRPGEKLHETLFGAGECDHRPLHPLISHVPVPPLDPAAAQVLDPYARREHVVAALEALCREPANVPPPAAALAAVR